MPSITSGKWTNIAAWFLTVLLGALFVFAGGTKLAGMQQHVEHFAGWGYPDWFRLVVGAIELVGGALLFVPKLARFAAMGLMVVMVGAVYTHLTHAEAASAPFPLVLLLLLGCIAYLRRESVALIERTEAAEA